MPIPFNRYSRKLHRWGAIIIAIPLLLVIVTGILLQIKKQVAWVQPPTLRGESSELNILWDDVLKSATAQPEAEIKSWDDIDRLDVRPGRGLIKVRSNNGWEVQIDASNANVLSTNYRRSDLIESLHDGSFFDDRAKITVFLANGLILLGLWFTGMWLWYLPISARRKKQKRLNAEKKTT
jgi:uncharacterized iron-regulated membrane protein